MTLMTILSLLAAPINIVFVTLMILYIMLLIRDLTIKDKKGRRELGVISGRERCCEDLAAAVYPAERMDLYGKPKQVLEQVIRRNVVLVFIVKQRLSPLGEGILKHLQYAYKQGDEKRYSKLRYAIFGIGDTSNETFNALAMEIDLSLRKLGATSVVPMRLYDVVTSVAGLREEYAEFLRQVRPRQPVKPLIVLSESTEDEMSADEHDDDAPKAALDHDDDDDQDTTDNEDAELVCGSCPANVAEPTEAVKPAAERKIAKNERSDDDDDDWELITKLESDENLLS